MKNWTKMDYFTFVVFGMWALFLAFAVPSEGASLTFKEARTAIHEAHPQLQAVRVGGCHRVTLTEVRCKESSAVRMDEKFWNSWEYFPSRARGTATVAIEADGLVYVYSALEWAAGADDLSVL